jgi:hypothetical protein
MRSRLPRPDSGVRTELALASDGTIYITVHGREPSRIAGRRMFVGYALRRAEVAALGARGLLVRAAQGRLALGSDGRVYVHQDEIDGTRGRKRFQGYAATEMQAACIVSTLHSMASGIVFDAGSLQRERAR